MNTTPDNTSIEGLFQFIGTEYLGESCKMTNPINIPLTEQTGYEIEAKVRTGKTVVGKVDIYQIKQHYFEILNADGFRKIYDTVYGTSGAMAGGDLFVYECDGIE